MSFFNYSMNVSLNKSKNEDLIIYFQSFIISFYFATTIINNENSIDNESELLLQFFLEKYKNELHENLTNINKWKEYIYNLKIEHLSQDKFKEFLDQLFKEIENKEFNSILDSYSTIIKDQMKFINTHKKPKFLLNYIETLKNELENFKERAEKISEKMEFIFMNSKQEKKLKKNIENMNLKQDFDKKIEEIKIEKEKNDDLKKKLTEKTSENESLLNKLNEIMEKFNKQEQSIENMQNKIDNMQNQIDNLQSSNKNMQNQIDNLQNKVNELTNENLILNKKIEKLQKEKEELSEESKNMQSQIDFFPKDIMDNK